MERKIIEKNRRMYMKQLYIKLFCLIPPQHFNPPKEFLSLQDQIEQVAGYIKNLKEKTEELTRKKHALLLLNGNNGTDIALSVNRNPHQLLHRTTTDEQDSSPVVRIRELGGSNLEIILIINRARNGFELVAQAIDDILEQEGAQVVTASLANIGDKSFHTLHAQVKYSRVGVEVSRISERIQQLVSVNHANDYYGLL